MGQDLRKKRDEGEDKLNKVRESEIPRSGQGGEENGQEGQEGLLVCLAEKAKVVTARQELNMVYTIVKTLRVGYSSENMPVKDETEVSFISVDNLKRWQEHFNSIHIRSKPENTSPIFEAAQNMGIKTKLQSIQEIKAIRKIKMTKHLE